MTTSYDGDTFHALVLMGTSRCISTGLGSNNSHVCLRSSFPTIIIKFIQEIGCRFKCAAQTNNSIIIE